MRGNRGTGERNDEKILLEKLEERKFWLKFIIYDFLDSYLVSVIWILFCIFSLIYFI